MSSSRLFTWLTTALMQLQNTDSKDRVCLCLPSKAYWLYPEPSSLQDSINWGGRDATWMIKPDVPTTITIKKDFQCTIFMVMFFSVFVTLYIKQQQTAIFLFCLSDSSQRQISGSTVTGNSEPVLIDKLVRRGKKPSSFNEPVREVS